MIDALFTKTVLLIRYLFHRVFTPFYAIGWKVVFQQHVQIRGAQYISLGNNVNLDSSSLLQVVEQENTKKTPIINIHANVGIGPHTVLLAKKQIEIEEDVMIGPHCVLVDYDHQYTDVSTPIRLQPLNNNHPIIVKRGAWISSHCTICSGVTIGEHAVIGANSVVTKDIPAYSVAVGSPARVVKRYNPKTKRWEKV